MYLSFSSDSEPFIWLICFSTFHSSSPTLLSLITSQDLWLSLSLFVLLCFSPMASVWRRLLKTETIPRISQSTRKLFSTDGSSSFAERLRNLPKEFPATQAKRDASLVKEKKKTLFHGHLENLIFFRCWLIKSVCVVAHRKNSTRVPQQSHWRLWSLYCCQARTFSAYL